jgi:hypothetical protein
LNALCYVAFRCVANKNDNRLGAYKVRFDLGFQMGAAEKCELLDVEGAQSFQSVEFKRWTGNTCINLMRGGSYKLLYIYTSMKKNVVGTHLLFRIFRHITTFLRWLYQLNRGVLRQLRSGALHDVHIELILPFTKFNISDPPQTKTKRSSPKYGPFKVN